VFILKKIFSRTSRSIAIKLSTNHPWVNGVLNCSNKGPGPLQRGDNHKMQKFCDIIKKKFAENHRSRIAHIYIKAS
jgi:hypothetical protein